MVNDLLTEQQALDTIQRFERLPHQERVSAAERLRAYKAAREAEGGPLFPTQAKAQQERYLALETLHLDKWDDYLDYLPQEQRNILDTQARRRPLAEFQRDVANRAFIEFATGKPVGVDYHAKMRQVGRTVLGLEGDVTPEAFNAAARERLTQRRAARESLVGAATAAQQAALAGVPRHQALSAYQKEAGAADDQTSAIFRRTHQEWEQKTERLRLPMERILRRMAARARPVNQPNAPPLLDTLDIAAEIAALPRDDQNLALQMINAMAREVGVNPERGVPGNEALATRRFFQNLGDGLTRWLGIAMETVRGAETLTEQFSPELQKTKEEARANRRILEIERRLSQIAQGTLDPIELQTEGWLPQLLESGLYATPQVFGFTATVGLGGAGGAFAATSYIAEENAKELLAEFPDMEDDTATAIGSVAAVPEMLLERFQAKEFLTSFKATRELLNRMTRGKLAGSLPRRIAAVTAAGAIQENVTEGIQDLTLPATQAYADGMNWLIGQIAPALARDVPSVDWGRELREWAGTRPEVFVSILPLVLIGAGGAAYRDFQGGELIIKNPELLRHVGFDEATISQITRMEPQEAQQAIVDNWQTRDTRSTAEITAGLVEREAARRRAIALGERAEALPEIRRQPDGGYQVAYPDGSAVQVGTYDAAAELRREWRGRNIDRMMNATVDMVEFYERIRSDRTQVLTNEFRTLQDVLEEQLGRDPTLDRGVLESRLWERVRILEEATNTVRSPDADLSNYPVLGDNVLEFKEKVLSGVIRLNQGATPVDVIQENAELDIKRWIAEGRVTEERVREMLQEWEQTSGDKILTGETTQDLVEAWSAMASSYAVARYKPEDAGEPIEGWTSTLRGILEKYRALLMGVMQRALLVEKARAEGTLDQDLETYLSEAVGLSSEIGVRRQAVREVGDLLGRTDFSVAPWPELRASTRLPTAKSATEDPFTELLKIESAHYPEEHLEPFAAAIEKIPNYRAVKSADTPEKIIKRFQDHLVSNLLWLYDQIPEDVRARAKRWYEGANSIANRWAKLYDIPVERVAAAIAVLSPQKDWFQNVSLAQRVIDIFQLQQETEWTPEMDATADRIPSIRKYKVDAEGRRLGDLTDPFAQAVWIRTYDETYHSRKYRGVTPEGEFIEEMPNNIGWGSFGEISKAVRALQSTSLPELSRILGMKHKVRNFYGNIIDPTDPVDVTIDTHAVAAALLRPLAGSSLEVEQVLGSAKGLPSSAVTGTSQLYAIYADAYREAARRRGVLPREMQSITWEAVRGLFPDVYKKGKGVDYARNQWEQFKKGRQSLDATRNAIAAHAGGIQAPVWVERSVAREDVQEPDSSYARELPGVWRLQGRLPRGDRSGDRGESPGGSPVGARPDFSIGLPGDGSPIAYRPGSREGRSGGPRPDRRVRSLTAEEFVRIAGANKASHKFGSSVDVYSPEAYDGYDLIVVGEGNQTATASISPTGEIGAVTKSPDAPSELVQEAFDAAVSTGKVRWLNGFDTVLPSIYSGLGFRAVARMPFNDEFAPEGWDYQAYGRFNGGRPDVVFMRYVGAPQSYADVQNEIPVVEDWDQAEALARAEPPPSPNLSIAGPDYFERLAGVVSGYMSDPDTRRAVYLEALRRLHNLRERLRGGLDEGTAEEHIATIQEDYDQEIAAVRQGREDELAQLSRDLEYERGAAEPGEREAISERYAGQRALVRERAKQQIETLQAQRKSDIRAARAAQREGDTVQVLAAYQAVMAAMPPEVRSRVGGFVRVAQARTIEARRKILLDRITRADVLLDKSLRRSYLDQIDAVLARSKPTGKGSETRKQPKLDVATDRIFKAVRRWAKIDPQEATAELQQVTAWLQAPTEPEGSDLHNRKLIEFQVGQRLAGYQDFDPVGLDQLLGWLTDLYGQGRVLKKMVDDARRQWVADTREAVVADVQSIPGRRPTDAQTSEYSVLGRAARFFDEHLASWQLLQSTYGRASKFVTDVNSRIRKATHARNDAMLALQAEMEQLFRVVFGTTSRVQWQRELYDLKKRKTWKVEIPQNVTPVQEARAVPADKAEEILAGRLKDPLYADPQNRQALADAVAQNNARTRPGRNVRVQVQVASPDLGPATMSDLEALYIIQTWRQANYRVAREAHGWTQDMIDAIEAEIDPRVWPIDAYLRRKYDEGWSELNRTYVAMFGTDMPRIANYAPGRVLHGGEDRASDPADVSGVGSAFGAVMTRVSHTNAFRQEDALSVFLSHRAQADHWRFFAPIIRDLRAVLMSPEAKTAVTRRHGEVTQRQVQTWISALEDDGIRAANGVIAAKKFIDRMMSSNARVVLGMKIGTLVKQANAAAASMLQIPVSEWAYSFGRVVTGQASARYGDLLKSSTIRRRIESGYSPEVRAGRAAWHETPKTYLGGLANRGLDAGVAPIGHVDAWFTTVSALIAYDYHYRKTGNREYALDQMDRVVFETAQPADTANRSLVELQAGGAGKMLFMFASEPRKQLAALWLAAKQVRRGEISGAEFARVAFVSLVLMPAITTVAYSFYKDLLLGRDDDEWGPEDLLIGTALNMPFTGTYLAGPAADSLVRYLLGERVYDSSENILNAVTIRAGSTGKKIAKGEADLDDVGRLIRELGRVFSTFSLPGVGYTVYDQVAEIIESLGD